jgi:hypothetical protein
MGWIDLAQDRDRWRALVGIVMNLLVPYNIAMFMSKCATSDFSRIAQLHAISLISQYGDYIAWI